jgi:hypothetical protein
MWSSLNQLLKQKYYVVILVLGAFFAGISCITVGQKDTYLLTHSPTPLALFVLGLVLILVSVAAFAHSVWQPPDSDGLDLSVVKESRGIFSTTIDDCEIRVVKGKLEDYAQRAGALVVLPCNEYFDDECAGDPKSALGAYVNSVFKDRCFEFMSLVQEQCPRVFGDGVEQEKTFKLGRLERAVSFGVGVCLLLEKPLDHHIPVALISTTTQSPRIGLGGSVSYLFEGIKNLFRCMADARLNEVVTPILGSGHGGVGPPLAFVGLLIAIAEAVRRGHGGPRKRTVTIVVYKQDKSTPAVVSDIVIRRGLALVAGKQASATKAATVTRREVA